MRTIEDVLAAGELFLAFQPIVDLDARRVFGYEALVRSRADEYPGPLQIIKAAVESGYMGQLGGELRSMAVRHCAHYPLFVNLHPDEFSEGWLVRPDDAILSHEHSVYLEITESVPLTHHVHCHSVLAEIRSKGIKVAVDDLGAGYSNLRYIADLEPEVVKLDRTLVAALTVGTRLHRLVASIVDLCRNMGARVVAEGIETRDELLAAIDAGAHFGQGYFLARPSAELSTPDLGELLGG